MADEHTTPEAEVVEAWLAGELEGDLLSYVIVDAQTWTRNLAARLRACGYRLSDEAFRALRKRVDNYAESRLAWASICAALSQPGQRMSWNPLKTTALI
jgi:hypothetical protein